MRSKAAALVLLFLLAGVSSCQAIEPLKVFRGSLIVEGRIEPGDYFSIRNFLSKKSNFERITRGVFLASPGGYVGEAMRIGRLIRSLGLTTDAPSGPATSRADLGEPSVTPRNLSDPKNNFLCASACFFVYAAGVRRDLARAGRLGIHRPIILDSELRALTGTQGEFAESRVQDLIKGYFKEMNVSEKYIDLMYSVPPTGLRWITQQEFDSDFKGYIPEIRALIESRCDTNISDKHLMSAMMDCGIVSRRSTEAWNRIFVNH